MKTLKTFMKAVGWTALTLVTLLFVAGFALLQWPDLILNPKTLEWGKARVNAADWVHRVRWKNVSVERENLGFLRNRLLVKLESFCYTGEKDQTACFDELSAGTAYDAFAWPPALTELGPIRVTGGNIKYVAITDPDAPEAESYSIPEIPFWLRPALLQEISIHVPDYDVSFGESRFRGRMRVGSRVESRDSGESLTYSLKLNERKWGDLEVAAATLSRKVEGPWEVRGQSALRLSPGRLNAEFSWTPKSLEDFAFELSARYSARGQSAFARTKGTWRENRLTGRMDARFRGPVQMRADRCDYAFRLGENDSEADFRCPFSLVATARGLSPRATARLEAHARTQGRPGNLSRVDARIELRPEEIFDGAVAGQGALLTDVSFIPGDLPELISLRSEVDLAVDVPRFARVVDRLRPTSLAVPAPFHVLGGRLQASLRGRLNENGGTVRWSALSRLSSRHQKMNWRSRGSVRTELDLPKAKVRDVAVTGELILDKIKLALPPVGVAPPGQIFADPRIRSASIAELRGEPAAKDPAFRLRYDFRVRTPKGAPVELMTEVTPETIPIALDLRMNEKVPLSGSVALNEFPLEVLGIRRQVEDAEVFLRVTERQQLVVGQSELGGSEETASMFYAPQPGDSVTRPSPQVPLSLAEIISGIVLRTPVSVAVVESETPRNLQLSDSDQKTVLQVRRRF